MTLTDLASLGSFISGVAVVVSFVFLSLQIRQTNKNQRALMQQGRSARNLETVLRQAEPHMIENVVRGRAGDLSMDTLQIEAFLRASLAMFMNWEDSFLQHQAGTIDPSGIPSEIEGMRVLLAYPGYRVAWKMLRYQFDGGYQKQIDDIVRTTTLVQPRNAADAWRSLLSEEGAAI